MSQKNDGHRPPEDQPQPPRLPEPARGWPDRNNQLTMGN